MNEQNIVDNYKKWQIISGVIAGLPAYFLASVVGFGMIKDCINDRERNSPAAKYLEQILTEKDVAVGTFLVNCKGSLYKIVFDEKRPNTPIYVKITEEEKQRQYSRDKVVQLDHLVGEVRGE